MIGSFVVQRPAIEGVNLKMQLSPYRTNDYRKSLREVDPQKPANAFTVEVSLRLTFRVASNFSCGGSTSTPSFSYLVDIATVMPVLRLTLSSSLCEELWMGTDKPPKELVELGLLDVTVAGGLQEIEVLEQTD